jgi:hypothetical protein
VDIVKLDDVFHCAARAICVAIRRHIISMSVYERLNIYVRDMDKAVRCVNAAFSDFQEAGRRERTQ